MADVALGAVAMALGAQSLQDKAMSAAPGPGVVECACASSMRVDASYALGPRFLEPLMAAGAPPAIMLPRAIGGQSVGMTLRDRFLGQPGAFEREASAEPPMSLEFATQTPINLDVSISTQWSKPQSDIGDYEVRRSDVRIGQGLKSAGPRNFTPPTWDNKAWYFYLASGREALTWKPMASATDPNADFRTQKRVMVGQIQLGVALQARNLQLSFAAAKINEKADLGWWRQSHDQRFAGFTLTWRG